MANVQNDDRLAKHDANGKHEVQRLAVRVEQLETECELLRQVLARTEAERDHYLKALYAAERRKINLDELRKFTENPISAGPVEML